MDMYKGMAGSPITYLTGDISAAQTTIAIADDSALPDAPNLCTIGYGENIETIRYGAKSNGVLQEVTRGIEGTPRAWQSGTEVARFFTAYDHNAIVETITSHLADYAALLTGGTIYTAALQNGFTGTLQYSKNALGQVWLRGQIVCPANPGTEVVNLPAEFRPPQHTIFNYYNFTKTQNVAAGGRISTVGGVSVGAGNPSSGDSIRINTIYNV